MELNYVLDTNVVIYAQKGILAEPLPIGHYFVSVITEIELFSLPRIEKEQEQATIELLRDVTVVGIDEAIVKETISLRRKYKLRIPDAIIAATAVITSSELCTNDSSLHAIEKIACRKMSLAQDPSK